MLQITPKQEEVVEAVRSREYRYILTGGAMASAKTYGVAVIILSAAYQYPNTRYAVCRRNLSTIKSTTLQTFYKVAAVMGIKYEENRADMRWDFVNGSQIWFKELDHTKDPDFDKVKGLELTAGAIDEVNEVVEYAFTILSSRIGRENNNGEPQFLLMTCNPTDNWVKELFYKPYSQGQLKAPYKFIPSLPTDNPFNSEEYINALKQMPRGFRKRYVEGNWDYFDDENSLFKARNLDLLTVNRITPAQKYIGVDPNAGGKDRACIVLWEGDTIVDIEVYTTEDLKRLAEPDELDPFNPGAVIGRLTVAMMEREGVGARYVAGDVVGIGQGWLTYMIMKGYNVRQFRAGDAPFQTPEEKRKNIKPPYNMLRSQVFHLWAMDTENSKCYFYSEVPHLHDLKKELLLHSYDNTAKIMAVESKEKLKKDLGYSPDIADAAVIGYWLKLITSQTDNTASQRASVGVTHDTYYNRSKDF